jgi:homoserine O-acetyltransferase
MLLMPSGTDSYFDAAELEHLARAELRPIPSMWGRRGGSPAGEAFLQEVLRAWLGG